MGLGLVLFACRAAPPKSATAPSRQTAPGVVVEGFSKSGKYVFTADGDEHILVTELATAKRVARIQLSTPQSIFISASDDEVVFEALSDSPDPGVEERFALPSGARTWKGVPEDWFSTPLGRARLHVEYEGDGQVTVAEAWLHPANGEPRRVDLRRTFGRDGYLRLKSLGMVGGELVLRSEGTVGATPMGRVGTINWRTGKVRLVPVLVGVVGDVVLRGDRLYLLQGPESGAWAFQLPSLRRVGRYTFADAHERREEELTMGEPPTCLALAPDGKMLAFVDSGLLRWYGVENAQKLGEAEAHLTGDFFSCSLTFTVDGRRLAHATRHGGLSIVDVASGNVVKELSYGRCTNCDRQIASGNMELTGGGLLSPDGRYFVGSEARLVRPGVTEGATYLVELATGRVIPWGDQGVAGFDPTGRYFISGDAIFHSASLREVGRIH